MEKKISVIPRKPKTTVSVRLSDARYDELTLLAQDEQMSRGALLARVFTDYLGKKDSQKKLENMRNGRSLFE